MDENSKDILNLVTQYIAINGPICLSHKEIASFDDVLNANKFCLYVKENEAGVRIELNRI